MPNTQPRARAVSVLCGRAVPREKEGTRTREGEYNWLGKKETGNGIRRIQDNTTDGIDKDLAMRLLGLMRAPRDGSADKVFELGGFWILPRAGIAIPDDENNPWKA